MSFQVLGFDLCPYGHLSWITALGAFFAMWMFLFPAFRCSLTVGKPPLTEIEVYVGYWSRESTEIASANIGDDGNYCVGWADNTTFDGIWKFGRALGVFGAITTGITTIIDILFIFFRFNLKWFFPLMGLHILNAIFSILLLIGLGSEACAADHCQIARGGVIAILACLLWFILAYLIWLLRLRELRMDDEEDEIPKKKKKAPPMEATELEQDVEQPLALMAPPPTSPSKKKKKSGKRSNDLDEERPLALPPSETSSQRRNTKSGTPKSPSKKKALPSSEQSPRRSTINSRTAGSSQDSNEERLALPFSETSNDAGPSSPKKSSKGRKKKRSAATP